MFCFSKRIEVENRCTVHLAHNLSSPVNCCEAYPNAYYIITNISHLTPGSKDHKLYMERLRFIGADNCFASCRKTVGKFLVEVTAAFNAAIQLDNKMGLFFHFSSSNFCASHAAYLLFYSQDVLSILPSS